MANTDGSPDSSPPLVAKVKDRDTFPGVLDLVGEVATTQRIVTGNITGSTGAISSGTGFTCVRNSAGNYTITFKPVFAAKPTITPSVASTSLMPSIGTPTGTSFTMVIKNTAAASTDSDWSFIAIQTV